MPGHGRRRRRPGRRPPHPPERPAPARRVVAHRGHGPGPAGRDSGARPLRHLAPQPPTGPAPGSRRTRRRVRPPRDRDRGGPGAPAGLALPGRRLGARCGRPAERRPHARRRRLRGRGRAWRRRSVDGPPVQARLLTRVPPLQRLRRPSPGHGGRCGGPPAPSRGVRHGRPRARMCAGRHRGRRRRGPHPRGAVPPLDRNVPAPKLVIRPPRCKRRSAAGDDDATVVAGSRPRRATGSCGPPHRSLGEHPDPLPRRAAAPPHLRRLHRRHHRRLHDQRRARAHRQRVHRPRDPHPGGASGRQPRRPRADRPPTVQLGGAQQRGSTGGPRRASCCSSTTTSRRTRAVGCPPCAPRRSGPTSPRPGPASSTRTGRLQHCGLVVGLTGAAGHVLGGLAEDEPGYLHMAAAARECSAVTGACLATRREVFELLGGFDEALGVDLNDVDYCLRAGTLGFRTMYEPAAELIHHESPSRGTAGGVGDVVAVRRPMEGVHFRGRPLLQPPPHPGGSVVRTGSPGGGGRLEPMVRDPHDAVADESEPAPRMLRQPADAPPPLGHVGGSDAVASFRRVCSDQADRNRRSLRALGRTNIRPIGSSPPAGAGRAPPRPSRRTAISWSTASPRRKP